MITFQKNNKIYFKSLPLRKWLTNIILEEKKECGNIVYFFCDDEFLLNKARSATSYSETNEKYLSTIKQLEDILLPGDSNLGNMIAKFFDGLQEIAASPADLAPRVAAMERGKTVAESFNHLAHLTGELKDGLEFQIQQDINDINILTEELFNLNSQLSGSSSKNAPNALLDSRDVLVDKLNQLALTQKKENPFKGPY